MGPKRSQFTAMHITSNLNLCYKPKAKGVQSALSITTLAENNFKKQSHIELESFYKKKKN